MLFISVSWKRMHKEDSKMAIEYLGLSSINGPLIALEGRSGCFL